MVVVLRPGPLVPWSGESRMEMGAIPEGSVQPEPTAEGAPKPQFAGRTDRVCTGNRNNGWGLPTRDRDTWYLTGGWLLYYGVLRLA